MENTLKKYWITYTLSGEMPYTTIPAYTENENEAVSVIQSRIKRNNPNAKFKLIKVVEEIIKNKKAKEFYLKVVECIKENFTKATDIDTYGTWSKDLIIDNNKYCIINQRPDKKGSFYTFIVKDVKENTIALGELIGNEIIFYTDKVVYKETLDTEYCR
jgi:hypothetical protein